jgi:hypothetical protein
MITQSKITNQKSKMVNDPFVNPPSEKKPFTQPKLTFIYPRLVKHGDATQNTHGFFGPFSV